MGNIIKNYYDNSQSNDIEINTPMSIDKILELRERSICRRKAEDAEVVAEVVKETETNDDSSDLSFTLTNLIFKTRIFDSTVRLEKLRGIIARAISMGNNITCINGKNEFTLNLQQKSEWYYLHLSFVEAKVTQGVPTAADLYRQMKAWFPEVAILEEGRTEEELIRKLSASISAEKGKWKEMGTEKIIPLKEMTIKNQAAARMKQERAIDLYKAAYKGLCVKLQELNAEILSATNG